MRRNLREDVPALTSAAPAPAPETPEASRRQLILEAVGMTLSGAAFGLVFGVAARTAGFSVAEAIAKSLFVSAGASQFAAVGLVAQSVPVPAIVPLTALLNAPPALLRSPRTVVRRPRHGGAGVVRPRRHRRDIRALQRALPPDRRIRPRRVLAVGSVRRAAVHRGLGDRVAGAQAFPNPRRLGIVARTPDGGTQIHVGIEWLSIAACVALVAWRRVVRLGLIAAVAIVAIGRAVGLG